MADDKLYVGENGMSEDPDDIDDPIGTIHYAKISMLCRDGKADGSRNSLQDVVEKYDAKS